MVQRKTCHVGERGKRERAQGVMIDRQIDLGETVNGSQAVATMGNGERAHRLACGSQANQIANDRSESRRRKPQSNQYRQ